MKKINEKVQSLVNLLKLGHVQSLDKFFNKYKTHPLAPKWFSRVEDLYKSDYRPWILKDYSVNETVVYSQFYSVVQDTDNSLGFYAVKKENSQSNSFDFELGHPYHAVHSSQLPPVLGFAFFTLVVNILFIFRSATYFNLVSAVFHIYPVLLIATVIFVWFISIFWEEFEGNHTVEVQTGFRYAILLFIISEFMLFVSFFWAFFHFALAPSSMVGGFLIPEGVVPFLWYRIPLLNTCLLLASGASLTICHMCLNSFDSKRKSVIALSEFGALNLFSNKVVSQNHSLALQSEQSSITLYNPTFWMFDTGLKGFIFLTYQVFEYTTALFDITDSVFGAIFYSLTGLHGFHVFIGVVGLFSFFIISTLLSNTTFLNPLSGAVVDYVKFNHRVGFDGSAWYWHFVDVVWFFVFIFIYWWLLAI